MDYSRAQQQTIVDATSEVAVLDWTQQPLDPNMRIELGTFIQSRLYLDVNAIPCVCC